MKEVLFKLKNIKKKGSVIRQHFLIILINFDGFGSQLQPSEIFQNDFGFLGSILLKQSSVPGLQFPNSFRPELFRCRVFLSDCVIEPINSPV